MTTRRSLARLACTIAVLLVLAHPAASGAARATGALPCELSTPDRIVAVGDVHGAYDQFVRILQAASLIDERQRWIGGGAILVQTGDVIDRGTDSRRVLDLLRRLESEAPRAGGRVVPLVGNHEVMAMVGDLRYVSAGEYSAFRTPDSDTLRERYYPIAVTRAEGAARASGQPFDADAFRAAFVQAMPLGAIELQLAFGPDGDYGRWLRERHAAVRINGIVFVHGGISLATAALGCAGINETVRSELIAIPRVEPARLASFLSTREDGPLWYRGLALENEASFASEVTRILEALGARAIVVGHTMPPGGRITVRFGGRVVQIDTGMLGGDFFPGGRPSALEIHDGRFVAIYEEGREVLPIRLITMDRSPSSAPDERPLPAR